MNILVPDSWLREYLKTKATPSQIKDYLSLCGPSVERLTKDNVYEIEITSNRPDAMSVFGIAREAAAILPRFGIAAALINAPQPAKIQTSKKLKLTIKTDSKLNPRWTSVVFDNVTVKASPTWLSSWLELTGIRSINNVIDITNFLMRAYGQPAHVFDYDAITGHSMTLRASRKGEKLTTLDGKTHTLPGDDIVIADGSGKLIDLCGIMGGKNSSVTDKTTRVVLFLQTYDPSHIRKTSMALAHRTEAAGLFEKGLDPEQVMPVFLKGIEMMRELTGGNVASAITDIYHHPYKASTVSVKRSKVYSYIGDIRDGEIKEILTSLGFKLGSDLKKKRSDPVIHVKVPSFRRDVSIDVDIIEEIARIFGYHNIGSMLPEGELPMTTSDPELSWEEEIKIRLRDWGYTELLTYSMISEEQMNIFNLDKPKAYKIANPLSNDWVYMRPVLWPSILAAIKQNLNHQKTLRIFEIGNAYVYREADLPKEMPVLVVAWTGNKFREAKGLAETIFSLLGLEIPKPGVEKMSLHNWDDKRRLLLGKYGTVSEVNSELLHTLGIEQSITVLDLLLPLLVADARPIKTYMPIPKYPPIVEDLAFVVPERFEVGPLIDTLKKAHPLISRVSLLDVHENTRTIHIEYQDSKRNLTNEEIVPIREKLIHLAEEKFGAILKSP